MKKLNLLGKTFLILGLFSPLVFNIANTYGAEDDLYDFLWLDPDKKVYVLQNKVYKKKNKFYANLGFVMGLNDNFQDSTGIQFKAGYYLHEEWAIEGVYHQYSNSDDDNFKSLQEINGSTAFVRAVEKKMGFMAVYSPFYGKINTFNKIIYFDWSFGLGLGQIQTESNAKTVSNSTTADQFSDESSIAVLAKTALRIHATKNIHVGIEYSRDNYRAPSATINGQPGIDSWRTNSEVAFSIGFSF